jgi:hypothetical protein
MKDGLRHLTDSGLKWRRERSNIAKSRRGVTVGEGVVSLLCGDAMGSAPVPRRSSASRFLRRVGDTGEPSLRGGTLLPIAPCGLIVVSAPSSNFSGVSANIRNTRP